MFMEDEVGRLLRGRNEQDAERRQELIQHPSAAIIPSPEKLDKSRYFRGQDVTKTLEDFKIVWRWLTSRQFSNPSFYAPTIHGWNFTGNQQLEPAEYNSFINIAFGAAFATIRNTLDRTSHEMVLLYYTGHGHAPPSPWARQDDLPSSRPHFERMFGLDNPVYNNYRRIERKYFPGDRRVRGGELCLHHYGYCDLKGLLTPWIAALRANSINSPGQKRNKHLVIILDSCYSGKFVEDLQELDRTQGPWNQNDCSVTVQSGCGSQETIRGGIFTPCFIKSMKNQNYLRTQRQQWSLLSLREKNFYRRLNLPSPRAFSTMPTNSPTTTLGPIQNLTLTLFNNAGFFKFIFTKVCHKRFRRLCEANAI